MSLKKMYLKMFLKGMPVGIVIGQIFLTINIVIFKFTVDWRQILIANISSMIIGGYCYGTTITYKIEKWSLLKQTLVQWALMLPYIPIAWFLGYIPKNVSGIIGFLIIYVAMILGFWFFYRWKYKCYVNEVNNSLEKWKRI